MKCCSHNLNLNLSQFGRVSVAKVGGIIVTALLLLTGTTTSLAADTFNFSVPATSPWFDTGIDVTAGTFLNITASGSVIYGFLSAQTTGPDGGNYIDPQYFPTAVLPNTYIVSLIGKVGGTTAVGTGTPVPEGVLGKGPGFVGSSYGEYIATSGRLFLGFNDQVADFGDNSGSFSAGVTVPEPSTAALAGVAVLTLLARTKKIRK